MTSFALRVEAAIRVASAMMRSMMMMMMHRQPSL